MKRATLMLTFLVLLHGGAGQVKAAVIFANSYNATFTFQDALGFGTTGGATTMTVAFDGTNYWSSAGGFSNATEYAQYDANGNFIANFNPGLDFRSIFTDATGTIFARQFADSTIFQQTTPGTFVSSGVVLASNSLDAQSSVVLNGAMTEYVAMSGGTVSRWDLAGSSLGTVPLSDPLGGKPFGSLPGEDNFPQGRGIAAFGNYWLTYDGNTTLSAWDFAGNRVGTTTLNGAGTSFDSAFSLSYANGMVFIVDQAGGTWRGYDLNGPTAVPEPSSLILFGTAFASFGGYFALRRRKLAAA
jgi:hypothetical protein